MTLHQYEQRFISELEDDYNSGGREEFVGFWIDFVTARWKEYEMSVN